MSPDAETEAKFMRLAAGEGLRVVLGVGFLVFACEVVEFFQLRLL
jgi:hypothetical protein